MTSTRRSCRTVLESNRLRLSFLLDVHYELIAGRIDGKVFVLDLVELFYLFMLDVIIARRFHQEHFDTLINNAIVLLIKSHRVSRMRQPRLCQRSRATLAESVQIRHKLRPRHRAAV